MTAGPTLSDCLDAYEADRRLIVVAPGRLRSTGRTLRRHFAPIDAADRRAVAAFVTRFTADRFAEGVGPATVRRDLITFRAALRHAWKQGHLFEQPYVSLPRQGQGRQRTLTVDEAQRLLAVCKPPLATFVTIALLTGARASAILDLTWSRVDLVGGTIDFRRPGQSPRMKNRAVVPLSPALADHLRPLAGEPVAPVIGRSYTAIQRGIRAGAKRAGLTSVSAHVLRHTTATWLLGDGGVSLLTASRILGHRSTLITEQVYTHLTAAHLSPGTDFLGATLLGGARP